ncbi:MAG: hypothetical protein JRJ72_05395 [Deltaproteobacteria bacterium]|nr:hypothetical protein [Deltaproteobacteria bacterium]MBW2355973.1 hypothetical protein [Deltaproteobacteria bacterium]
MTIDENHPLLLQMLAELHRRTGGDLSASVSMYDLGAAAGIDRQGAQEVGQALIGAGLAAIVSLSGKIGITAEGIAYLEDRGAAAPAREEGVRLGAAPVVEPAAREAVEVLVARIKTEAGGQQWPFEAFSELAADLRTIEAQLASPRPKAAILRECLRAVRALLDRNGARGALPRIDALIN